MRIGTGYDVHRLTEGRKLILGGVTIPYEKGLLGHSDADVLLHAVMDALLGAAALGDIGQHFPDKDAAYKDIDSRVLLRKVRELLAEIDFCAFNTYAVNIPIPEFIPFFTASFRGQVNAAHLLFTEIINNIERTCFIKPYSV